MFNISNIGTFLGILALFGIAVRFYYFALLLVLAPLLLVFVLNTINYILTGFSDTCALKRLAEKK